MIRTGSPKWNNRRKLLSGLTQLLLQHLDGIFRNWRPSCFVSMVQGAGGGVTVWRVFSWHILNSLVPNEYNFSDIGYCC